MHRPLKTIATILLLFGVAAPFSPHEPAKRSIRSSQLMAAEAYSKEVDSFIKQNPERKRLFSKVAANRKGTPGRWREFQSAKELEAADTDNKLGDNIHVWIRNGMVVGAFFISQETSRDWAQYVMYHFREDGSLVMTNETFKTFYANISAEKVKVFSPSGRVLRSSSKYFDLRTGQEKRPNGFASVRPPAYRNVRSLPFYELLRPELR